MKRTVISEPAPAPPGPAGVAGKATEGPRSQPLAGFAVYAAAVFVVAWILWYTADLIGRQLGAGFGVRSILYLPGTFAPAMVALAFAFHRVSNAHSLLASVTHWNVRVGWYAFALVFMAGVKLLAASAHRILVGSWPEFGTVPLVLMFGAALMSAPFQVGEELGWRGYALPLLMKRFGVGAAGLLLGLVWALWHLPLFFLPGADMVGQPLPVFVISVTALSVVMAVVWHRTGGSLPVLMLMHAAVNNTTGVVPAAGLVADQFSLEATPMAWLTAGILSSAAVVAAALPSPVNARGATMS